MTDRTKPGVAFWATVVVAVGLLYPISFGPACWLSSRTGIGVSALPAIYHPIITRMNPSGITRIMAPGDIETSVSYATVPPTGTLHFYPKGIIGRYAELLAADGWRWRQSIDYPIDIDDSFNLPCAGQWEWSMSGP
jgi:hypothetical protein